MNTKSSLLLISELKKKFSSRETVLKSEFREFYQFFLPDLSEQAFRRIIYSLEKEKIIIPLGAGVYVFQTNLQTSNRKIFNPHPSTIVQLIRDLMANLFPYTPYVVWETQVVHECMTHQPGVNQIVLEVDKEATESVFNKLIESRIQNIYFKPDKDMINRYTFINPDTVLIFPLITQSPRMNILGTVHARLEKILVDIYSDEEHFFIFQGQEMINIFENVFASYWINTKTLFRYAGRRKAEEKLRNFIKTQTQIILPSL